MDVEGRRIGGSDMNNVFLILAILIFSAGLLRCIVRKTDFDVFTRRMTAVSIVTALFMAIPAFLMKSTQPNIAAGFFYALSKAALYAIKTAAGGLDLDFILPAAAGLPGPLYWILFALCCFLSVFTPVICSVLVLSLFAGVTDIIHYAFSPAGEQHVFVSLNENSLQLASDICKKTHHGLLVFCNVEKQKNNPLVQKAHKLHAVCLSRSESDVYKKGTLYFYCLSESEESNITSAIRLLECFEERQHTWIYLFASASANRLIIDNIPQSRNRKARVLLIDSTQILAYDLMDRFPVCTRAENGHLDVLLLGVGSIGRELLSAILFCGQIRGTALHIWCVDSRAEAISRQIGEECPELSTDAGNYDIRFVQIDFNSTELNTFLASLEREIGWAAVTTSDDEMNMRVAVRLYDHLKGEKKPVILTRVAGSAIAEQFSGVLARGGAEMSASIRCFGSESNRFALRYLHQSDLARMALNIDLCYEQILTHEMYAASGAAEPEETLRDAAISRFYQSYSEQSSMASALCVRQKLLLAGVSIPTEKDGTMAPLGKEQADLFDRALQEKPELREYLAENEHDRWLAYTRVQGYRRTEDEEIVRNLKEHPEWKGKNMITKTHPSLVPWEKLDELDETIAAAGGGDAQSKAKDAFITDNIGNIIRKDYRREDQQ